MDADPPDHSRATECLALLQEHEANFVDTSQASAYWNAVSFEYFHLAQASAKKGDTSVALAHVGHALVFAAKSSYDVKSDWIPYIEGTKAYLEGDLPALQKCMNRCQENRVVLQRLYKGLRQRGVVSYNEDYYQDL